MHSNGVGDSERDQTYALLRESEACLRSIFLAAPVGIGVVSNRVFTQANELLCRMVGYSEEELLGKSSRLFYLSDEDYAYVGQEKYRQIAATGTGTVETRWLCKDGSVIDVLLSSTPMDQDDLEKGVTFTALDITDRLEAAQKIRRSEAKYRGLIESTRDWIWEIDAEGRYTYSSPQVESILGYTPEQIVGRMLFDLVSDESVAEKRKELERMIGTLEPVVALENHAIHRDGHEVILETSGVPVLDDDGHYAGFRAVDRDITARRRAEQERKKLEEQYHQAQKVESIGRLAGGIAHDLNNLLSPILGYSELLLDDELHGDGQRESVEEIMRAGIRARDLVRQLLAFSRKQTLEYKALDLGQAVKGFEKLLRHTIREDIAIDIRTREDLPLVMADVGQIEQVLMNLMINAQDAMPEGGVITLETGVADLDADYLREHPESTAGAHVMLAVSDNGCGMDAETQQRIFEPFFSTKGELGTGLGLATVYGIVKQHGGNAWVYSEPGQGTTFKVLLPVSPDAETPVADENKPTDGLHGSETVLVVEDNEHVRELSCSILRRHGYHVLSAEGGPQARQVVEEAEGAIQLLLSDVVMPEMNGKEIYEMLAERIPGLRVVFMSGYTDDVIVNRGVLEDGVMFIQKPFTIRALTQKVREVLDRE